MEIKNVKKQYKRTKHTVYSCQYHIVFCPKYRRSVLVGDIALRLKELITERQVEYNYEVLDIEVMPDHVHMLLDVNPEIGVYTTISRIKGYTSRILRQEFPKLKSRLPSLWTRSKFISSAGTVTLKVVKQYIEDQKNR